MAKKGTTHARKDGQRSSNRPTRAEWKGYCNPVVSTALKDAISRAVAGGFSVGVQLEECILEGYKFSITWDDYNDCFTAALYAQNEDSVNAGWCATFRGSTIDRATLGLLYWHAMVANRDWNSVSTPSNRDDVY